MEPFHTLLMPEQDKPMNGDYNITNEFIKLRDRFGLTTFCELGTCLGSTSLWASDHFKEVYTIEINSEFRDYAIKRFEGRENIFSYLGSTTEVLPEVLPVFTDKTLILVDSHWNEHFPLLEELNLIKESGLKPVIAIHDCRVPNEPLLGFDSYAGVTISFETIHVNLDEIYGEEGYEYYYNSDATSTSIKRGVVYIYPKQNNQNK